ncbi:hypothetical protein CHELA20_53475 [Hyphomicrobiales bacterium]|nr:hypothetical protein CHELA41_21453 [Hyphomicrobiales bacterium]CAH1684324.1 hypothetical protein CHELA20_53475 [Hyphomicrobiales bacterium]
MTTVAAAHLSLEGEVAPKVWVRELPQGSDDPPHPNPVPPGEAGAPVAAHIQSDGKGAALHTAAASIPQRLLNPRFSRSAQCRSSLAPAGP